MFGEDEIRGVIADVCLEHKDSGENSVDREAYLIMSALKEKGFDIIKVDGKPTVDIDTSEDPNNLKEWKESLIYWEDRLTKDRERLKDSDFIEFSPEIKRIKWNIKRVNEKIIEHNTANTKADRIIIVNKIIKVIALTGRNFFLNKSDNDMAYILEENGRIYMYNEYNKTKMYLQAKDGSRPEKWHHGGTLWGLVNDFKEYIEHGGDTNHNNGYGGLYCDHWGYDKESMDKVQEIALKLGYLKPKQ